MPDQQTENMSQARLSLLIQAELGLDVSPDGRYLAYAQLDDPGSVLTMVANFH